MLIRCLLMGVATRGIGEAQNTQVRRKVMVRRRSQTMTTILVNFSMGLSQVRVKCNTMMDLHIRVNGKMAFHTDLEYSKLLVVIRKATSLTANWMELAKNSLQKVTITDISDQVSSTEMAKWTSQMVTDLRVTGNLAKLMVMANMIMSQESDLQVNSNMEAFMAQER